MLIGYRQSPQHHVILLLSMSILSGISDFFGLDIGTSAIRVVQLKGNNLVRYGASPLDASLARSDSPADIQRLAVAIRDMLREHRITSKNVAVGLPSSKVFTTIVDIDKLPEAELGKSIIYQADSIIPTPVKESKIDWALLGDSPKEANKVEVLVSSVANDFVERRLDMLEDIGLNVIAFEPDSIALSRSLIEPTAAEPRMIVDLGSKSTDIVVVMDGAPRLIRSIFTGVDALVKAASQGLNIDQEQARRFVAKFGLSTTNLEGQVREAILPTVDTILAEVDKSINFFNNRYRGRKLERIIANGGAESLPDLPTYMASKFDIDVEFGDAWKNVDHHGSRNQDLNQVARHFGVAAGLAERSE